MTDQQLIIKIKADTDKAVSQVTKLTKQVDKLTKENKKFGNSSKEIGQINKSFESLGRTLKGVAAAYLSFEGARKLISTTADIESGFIGVAKTTGLAGEELEVMKGKILDLSTELAGVSIGGLQSVAESAGQLGISGTENILKFTEVMAKMGTATDLSAEEAAVAMAKLGNSLGEPVANFENMGSVINELSNTTTATASDLVDVGQRISGAGKSFGLATSEVFGFSATLKDVGLSAEIAGTAFSKVLLKMLTNTKDFASTVGLDINEFSRQVRDEPVKAIQSFLEALGKLDKEAKIQALTDLKLTGAGIAQTLLKLSDNTGLLSQNLKIAGDEWERNTSLQKEYETAAQGLDAQFERAKNAIAKLAFEIGEKLLPKIKEVIDDFVKWIDGLDDARVEQFANDIADMASAIADVVTVLGSFIGAIGSVIALNPKLFAGILGIVGVMKVLNGLLPGISTGLISMGGSAATVTAASTKVKGALGVLGTTIRTVTALAGPWGLAFAAMAGATTLAVDAYTDSVQRTNEATKKTTQELDVHSTKMQSISDMYMKAQSQMAEYGSVSVSTREQIRQALETEKAALEQSIQKLGQNTEMTKAQEQAYLKMAEQLGVLKASLDTLDATYTVDMSIDVDKLEREKEQVEQDPVKVDIETDGDKFEKEYNAILEKHKQSPLLVKLNADTKEFDQKVEKAKKPTKSEHKINPDTKAIIDAINKLKQPTSSVHTIYERIVSARSNGGQIPQKLATGGTFTGSGKVPGYDPTDSDKVNALLTGGEFVIKRSAVDAYGSSMLHAINNMSLPKFATGGEVSNPSSKGDLQPININIGGKSFGMMTDRDIAEALQRHINSEGGL